jgi:hypothetical protein
MKKQAKKLRLKTYRVPVWTQINGEAIVRARNPVEAEERVQNGKSISLSWFEPYEAGLMLSEEVNEATAVVEVPDEDE